MRHTQKPVSPKQLAANRANAAHSSGPKTPEGKARSAQNSLKHGFTASTFAVVRLEDLQEIGRLKFDLVSVYQPVNSQELFALERMALSQQAILRAARLESGLFTTSLNETLDSNDRPFTPMSKELAGDGSLEITRAQNRTTASPMASSASSSASPTVKPGPIPSSATRPRQNANTAAPSRISTASKLSAMIYQMKSCQTNPFPTSNPNTNQPLTPLPKRTRLRLKTYRPPLMPIPLPAFLLRPAIPRRRTERKPPLTLGEAATRKSCPGANQQDAANPVVVL